MNELTVKSQIGNCLVQFNEIDNKIQKALENADNIKSKAAQKHSAGWSFGGKDKRIAIEALQDVTSDLADSQIELVQTQEILFNAQKRLSQNMTTLYQIGAMSLAANRMVYNELKLKLSNASREQLSELAKEELRRTIKQIEEMQDALIVQERQKQKILEHEQTIESLKNKASNLGQTSYSQSQKIDSQGRDISDLQKNYDSIAMSLGVHGKQIQVVAKKADELEGKLSNTNNRVDRQINQLDEVKKVIVDIDNKIKTLREIHYQWKSFTDLAISEHAKKLEETKASLESSIKCQGTMLLSLEKSTEILNNQVLDLETSRNALSTDINDLRTQLDNVTNQLSGFMQRVDSKGRKFLWISLILIANLITTALLVFAYVHWIA